MLDFLKILSLLAYYLAPASIEVESAEEIIVVAPNNPGTILKNNSTSCNYNLLYKLTYYWLIKLIHLKLSARILRCLMALFQLNKTEY